MLNAVNSCNAQQSGSAYDLVRLTQHHLVVDHPDGRILFDTSWPRGWKQR